MRVKFIKHAAWRGVGFRPGDETEMDRLTAEVYFHTAQAVQAPDPPAADTNASAEAAAIAAKPTVKRGGQTVETTAAPKREKRGTERTQR